MWKSQKTKRAMPYAKKNNKLLQNATYKCEHVENQHVYNVCCPLTTSKENTNQVKIIQYKTKNIKTYDRIQENSNKQDNIQQVNIIKIII